jgi:hypothetical protein
MGGLPVASAATSSVRRRMPSLGYIRARWDSTVRLETKSWAAISLLLIPEATRSAIRRSLGVRLSQPVDGRAGRRRGLTVRPCVRSSARSRACMSSAPSVLYTSSAAVASVRERPCSAWLAKMTAASWFALAASHRRMCACNASAAAATALPSCWCKPHTQSRMACTTGDLVRSAKADTSLCRRSARWWSLVVIARRCASGPMLTRRTGARASSMASTVNR